MKKKDVINVCDNEPDTAQQYLQKLSGRNQGEEILKKLKNIESIMETISEALETISGLAERMMSVFEYIQQDTECIRTFSSRSDF